VSKQGFLSENTLSDFKGFCWRLSPKPSENTVGKGKSKAQHIDSDKEEEMDDDDNDSISDPEGPPDSPSVTGTNMTGGDLIKSLPKPPSSAARNRMSRRAFLNSLSDDKNYKTLLLLLKAADVSTEYLMSALTICIHQ
jgi:hypothetical protein